MEVARVVMVIDRAVIRLGSLLGFNYSDKCAVVELERDLNCIIMRLFVWQEVTSLPQSMVCVCVGFNLLQEYDFCLLCVMFDIPQPFPRDCK